MDFFLFLFHGAQCQGNNWPVLTPEMQLLDLRPVDFHRLVALVSGVNIAKDHPASNKWHRVRFTIIATIKQTTLRRELLTGMRGWKMRPSFSVFTDWNMRSISDIKKGKRNGMRREEKRWRQEPQSEKLFMVMAGVGYAAKSRGGWLRDCTDLHQWKDTMKQIEIEGREKREWLFISPFVLRFYQLFQQLQVYRTSTQLEMTKKITVHTIHLWFSNVWTRENKQQNKNGL